jgi:hypothetical protein
VVVLSRGSAGEDAIQVYGADGTFITSFAEQGTSAGLYDVSQWDANIAYSPQTDRIYLTLGRWSNRSQEVFVFTLSGTLDFSFRTDGILAATLEDYVRNIQVRVTREGETEIWLEEHDEGYFKVFDASGNFKRLFDFTVYRYDEPIVGLDELYLEESTSSSLKKIRGTAISNDRWTTRIYKQFVPSSGLRVTRYLGNDSDGRIVYLSVETGSGGNVEIGIYEGRVYNTFDPGERNAVPEPFVTSIVQRDGSNIIDFEYRVEDADSPTVTTAAIAFAGSGESLNNVIGVRTLVDGSEAALGANIPVDTIQKVSWNAESDWNVDFGDVRLAVLARDERSYFFDVHLVTIPADGGRPGVTISRTPLYLADFDIQWFWLIATDDPSINLVDGAIFGAGGEFDGVQLANSTNSTTAEGRRFLLQRDGLREATQAEVIRAREGATPGFVASIPAPFEIERANGDNLPDNINEYGISVDYLGSSLDRPDRWTAFHVVLDSAL